MLRLPPHRPGLAWLIAGLLSCPGQAVLAAPGLVTQAAAGVVTQPAAGAVTQPAAGAVTQAIPGVVAADRRAVLLAEHARLQASLAVSNFGEPLLLHPTSTGEALHSGAVMAVLQRPLGSVAAVMRSATSVCGMLILHLNVRDCQPAPGAGERLLVTAGPMRVSLPGLLQRLPLLLLVEADAANYLSVRLTAPLGPLGTSDLRLHLEAVALTPAQTYLHIGYSQASGLAARLAARAYLATAGQGKVGFSSDDTGEDGRSRLVGGERGALQRNVMRHDMALLVCSTVVDGTPDVQRAARLRAWHALTERHATQLHEIALPDSLAEKRGVARPRP